MFAPVRAKNLRKVHSFQADRAMLILGCLTAAECQQHYLNAKQEHDEKQYILHR
jgi:hypothetical protein